MKKLRSITSTILVFALVCGMLSGMGCISKAYAQEGPGKAFYVATNGADTNDGTFNAPFASLEKARDAIRELKSTSGLPEGGVTVYLREGAYSRLSSFELDEADSGTDNAPITFKSYNNEEVSIMGGYNINSDSFVPVTDGEILNRLPEEARDKVWQVNLKAQGITEYGVIPKAGYNWPPVPPAPELFINNKTMTLARYPNKGFMLTGDVIEEGFIPRNHMHDKPAGDPSHEDYVPEEEWINQQGPIFKYTNTRINSWEEENEIWLFGYWKWDWAFDNLKIKDLDKANKKIEASSPSFYGINKGQRFYAYNLLSEIDMPGEWYLDRVNGMLYVYPETDIKNSTVQMSVLDTPLINMNGVSNIKIQGITFEISRGHGIKMMNCSNNLVVDCTFRRLGQKAVVIGDEDTAFQNGLIMDDESGGGTNNGIVACDIYETGAGGISITGGNRKTLTPVGNYAENNHIYDYARIVRTYTPAIKLIGTGLRASNNLIHDAPHFGIEFRGNDNIIENNEIYKVCQETSDTGAIYSGRDWTYRGNIIRNNYIHDISAIDTSKMLFAVYFDDFMSSAEVTGNILYNIKGTAFLVGCGRDHIIKNNIMINCNTSVEIDNRGAADWAAPMAEAPNGTCYKALIDVPYKEEPWASKYPTLVNIWEDEPKVPKGNVVKDNVLCNSGALQITNNAKTYGTIQNNISITAENAGFVDMENRNFALIDSSVIYQEIPGFPQIPFNEMGLKVDEYRTNIGIGDFNLIAPQNDATNINAMNVIFQWEAADGCDGYELIVAEDEEFTKVIIDEKLTGTSKAIDGLTSNRTYYWKVKAHTLASSIPEGECSEVYKFTTGETCFTEGFENGFAGWISEKPGTPVVSSEQKHGGENSFKINHDEVVISKTFSNNYNGKVTIWYYDNTSPDAMHMAKVDACGDAWGVGIGVNKKTKYQVRIPTWTDTNIDRTKGWHKFTWDYTSGNNVVLYIDDKEVASSSEYTSFNKISMGDFWASAPVFVQVGYFDDVIVENARVPVEGLAISKPLLELEIGQTEVITATVTPDFALNKNVTWKSSDDEIASVDQYGAVTGNAEGTATITVTTQEGEYTKTCTVTVKKPKPKAVLTAAGDTVNAGDEFTVSYALNTVSQSVYAQDITIQYNEGVFAYVDVQSLIVQTVILEVYQEPGQCRFIVASLGEPITCDAQVLDITFKAKKNAAGTKVITLLNAELANDEGIIIKAVTTDATIEVIGVDKTVLNQKIAESNEKLDSAVEGIETGQYHEGSKNRLQAAVVGAQMVANNESATQADVDAAAAELWLAIDKFDNLRITENTGDINSDGTINIGDLGIVAGHYGEKEGSSNWGKAKVVDINGDGEIGLYDLAFIAKRIIRK